MLSEPSGWPAEGGDERSWEAAESAGEGKSLRFRLTLAYLGHPFSGWQRQPNAPTVQETLEAALAGLVGGRVATTGAGRTDAGVHARGQVVHGTLPRPLPTRALVYGLNARLPASIRVLAALEAPAEFDARRHAEAKAYSYRLSRAAVVSPFESPFVWQVPAKIDPAALRDGATRIVGRHDFSAFALAGGSHRSAMRTVFAAEWREAGEELHFHIVGDGFLRGMVRGLVGTLVEGALGRREPGNLTGLLAGGTRGEAGPTAPAAGLCLEQVFYPAPWGGPPRREESNGGAPLPVC